MAWPPNGPPPAFVSRVRFPKWECLADAIRNLPRTSILDSVWILIKLEFQNLSLLNKLRRLAKAPSGSMPAKSGFFLFAVAPRRQPGRDRTSVVSGKSVSVRLYLGG